MYMCMRACPGSTALHAILTSMRMLLTASYIAVHFLCYSILLFSCCFAIGHSCLQLQGNISVAKYARRQLVSGLGLVYSQCQRRIAKLLYRVHNKTTLLKRTLHAAEVPPIHMLAQRKRNSIPYIQPGLDYTSLTPYHQGALALKGGKQCSQLCLSFFSFGAPLYYNQAIPA